MAPCGPSDDGDDATAIRRPFEVLIADGEAAGEQLGAVVELHEDGLFFLLLGGQLVNLLFELLLRHVGSPFLEAPLGSSNRDMATELLQLGLLISTAKAWGMVLLRIDHIGAQQVPGDRSTYH